MVVVVVVVVVGIVAVIVVAETNKKKLSYDKSSDESLQCNSRVTTEGTTCRFRVLPEYFDYQNC